MSKKPRRQFSTEQKVAILRRHFIDKVAVSALCDEYELQPSVFYYWQKQAFENLAGAFQPVPSTSPRAAEQDREIEGLKAKLAKKNDVIAEISEEYVTLKKKLGEP